MAPVPARDDSSESPRRGRSRRRAVVLIADDTADVRDLFSVYLKSLGFAVIAVSDGRAAIALARNLRPDVIVMDLSMPDVDGLTATKQIKQDARTRRTPVILLTGYPARAIQQGALEAGVDVFLTKPCLPEDLEAHIRRILNDDRASDPRRAAL